MKHWHLSCTCFSFWELSASSGKPRRASPPSRAAGWANEQLLSQWLSTAPASSCRQDGSARRARSLSEGEHLNQGAGAVRDSLPGLPKPTGVGWHWKTNSELEQELTQADTEMQGLITFIKFTESVFHAARCSAGDSLLWEPKDPSISVGSNII